MKNPEYMPTVLMYAPSVGGSRTWITSAIILDGHHKLGKFLLVAILFRLEAAVRSKREIAFVLIEAREVSSEVPGGLLEPSFFWSTPSKEKAQQYTHKVHQGRAQWNNM
jgi:hypothetical protein